MTLDEARKIVEAYEALVDHALKIVSDVPFYVSVGDDDYAHLHFDGDNAVLSWCSYESDYYGGGSLSHDEGTFPAEALLLSDADLKTLRARVKKEAVERNAKLKAAEAAVARDRAEARDKAEFARLKAKFENQQ